jgi:hypothetical protein
MVAFGIFFNLFSFSKDLMIVPILMASLATLIRNVWIVWTSLMMIIQVECAELGYAVIYGEPSFSLFSYYILVSFFQQSYQHLFERIKYYHYHGVTCVLLRIGVSSRVLAVLVCRNVNGTNYLTSDFTLICGMLYRTQQWLTLTDVALIYGFGGH